MGEGVSESQGGLPAGDAPGLDLTGLLRRARAGDAAAAELAFASVADRLRRIAGHFAKSCRPGETLTTTALVGEAYLRLFGGHGAEWNDRAHFFSVAARAMRSIVVDHARARRARGSQSPRDPSALDAIVSDFERNAADDVIELDAALDDLARLDERMAKALEYRFYGGLPIADVAKALGSSVRTTERDIEMGKRWLEARLRADRDDAAS